MNSSKNVIIGAVVVVAVVLIGWLVLRNGETVDNTGGVTLSPTVSSSRTPLPTRSVTPLATPKATLRTIHLTAQGVTPKTLTIRVGDAVSFINDTGTSWWPASDPHPTHTLCSGFDAQRSLGVGESYTLTFSVARTCTYHNHRDASNPAYQGAIIIQ